MLGLGTKVSMTGKGGFMEVRDEIQPLSLSKAHVMTVLPVHGLLGVKVSLFFILLCTTSSLPTKDGRVIFCSKTVTSPFLSSSRWTLLYL